MSIYIKIVKRTKAKSDGTFPIVLRVTKDRKTRLIYLGLNCITGEFENQEFTNKAKNFRKRNQILSRYKDRAWALNDTLVAEQKAFTVDDFVRRFRNQDKDPELDFIHFQKQLILELRNAGKYNTARIQKEIHDSLIKFHGPSVLFRQVNLDFLSRYVNFLESRENTGGGVSFRLRAFRAAYNKGLKRLEISVSKNPFTEFGIGSFKSVHNARFLTVDEFKLIRDFDLSLQPNLQLVKDVVLFSFYCRGMNWADIGRLKKTQVSNGQLKYVRRKTKGKFSFKLLPPAIDIINRYQEICKESEYVFPIIPDGASEERIVKVLDYKRCRFNKQLKALCVSCGINPEGVSIYALRHSYAMIMRDLGSATDFISACMGHADIKTTQAYLKSLEPERLDDENLKLLDL